MSCKMTTFADVRLIPRPPANEKKNFVKVDARAVQCGVQNLEEFTLKSWAILNLFYIQILTCFGREKKNENVRISVILVNKALPAVRKTNVLGVTCKAGYTFTYSRTFLFFYYGQFHMPH